MIIQLQCRNPFDMLVVLLWPILVLILVVRYGKTPSFGSIFLQNFPSFSSKTNHVFNNFLENKYNILCLVAQIICNYGLTVCRPNSALKHINIKWFLSYKFHNKKLWVYARRASPIINHLFHHSKGWSDPRPPPPKKNLLLFKIEVFLLICFVFFVSEGG